MNSVCASEYTPSASDNLQTSTQAFTADLERSEKTFRQHARVIFCLPQVEAGTLFDTQNAKHW